MSGCESYVDPHRSSWAPALLRPPFVHTFLVDSFAPVADRAMGYLALPFFTPAPLYLVTEDINQGGYLTDHVEGLLAIHTVSSLVESLISLLCPSWKHRVIAGGSCHISNGQIALRSALFE